MALIWEKIEPVVEAFAERSYRTRPYLSAISRDEALRTYETELVNFARLIDPGVVVQLHFLADTRDSGADAPVDVCVERAFVRIGIQERFFEDDIAGSAKANRLLAVTIILASLAQRIDGRTARFTVGLMDDAYACDVGFCSRQDSVSLVPDPEFLMSGGYARFRAQLADRWIAWDDRMEIVMWRGSTTGAQRPVGSYKSATEWYKILLRTEVCARLRNEPFRGRCNVGISSIVQIQDPEVIERIERELKRPAIPRLDQAGYRYMLDIDGNTNAWAGLMQALLLGGSVIKIASEHGYRQWYYDKLHARENCVVVRPDLSDLEEVVDWSLTNVRQARDIARAGRRLADAMSYEDEISAAVEMLVERFSQPSVSPPPPMPSAMDEEETAVAADRQVPLRLPAGSKITIAGSHEDISVVATLAGNDGSFEPYLSALFRRIVKPDWVCLDIGANIGAHTLGLASLAAKVFAFEAEADNCRLLRANVAGSPFVERIEVIERAAWDKTEDLVIASTRLLQGCSFITADDADATEAKLRAANPNPLNGRSIETLLRPTKSIRLDDWSSSGGLARVDFIKIDVEGAETRALAGAGELLRRFKPILVTEYNPACATSYFAQTPDYYFEVLRSIFSKIYVIGDDGEASDEVADWAELDRRLAVGKGWEDLLCLP